MICVLHPFGKDLKLNPHVHVLVRLNGVGEWVPVTFFEYGSLRRIWQYQLLKAVKRRLPNSPANSVLIDRLFKDHKEGFYVFAKRRVTSPRGIARYVARYVRHPAIAESRLSEFNRLLNTVTFWYRDEDGGVRRSVTFGALDFIGRLARLIPDRNLKLIRYYGLYSRRTKGKLLKVLTSLSREKRKVVRKKEGKWSRSRHPQMTEATSPRPLLLKKGNCGDNAIFGGLQPTHKPILLTQKLRYS